MGKTKIGFIGVGNMAHGIINGLVNAGVYSKKEIYVCDSDIDKIKKCNDEGFICCADGNEVFQKASVVFLAVKPADVKKVLESVSASVTVKNVIVSIAAGISIGYIKKSLGHDCKVIRVMPNMACSVGCGATALTYEMPITYNEITFVSGLFESMGSVEIVSEDKMNDIISVNSSSPVFLYMLVRAMISGAKGQGIEDEVSEHMVLDTVEGALKLIKESGKSLDEMISEVCTPNGTTMKAVDYLEKRGFEQSISDAMLCCSKRAAQIEKELEV